MKVQLAVEHDGEKPDAIVDLDDAQARRLISQGRARLPEKSEDTEEDKEAAKVAAAVQAKADESLSTATVNTVATPDQH